MVNVVEMVSAEIARNICKELISGSLQCQICLRFMFPPWQCLFGHTLCWTCHKKDFRCPFCRTPRSYDVVCSALFKIASKFPVSCALNCGYVEFPYALMSHLSECKLKMFMCPVTRMETDSKLRANRTLIRDHYIAEHSNYAIRSNTATFKVGLRSFLSEYRGRSAISCSRECFFINGNLIQMWSHICMYTCTLSLALMFYGPGEQRLNYKVLITVKSNGVKRNFMVLCSPYVDFYSEICDAYKATFLLNGPFDRNIEEPTIKFQIIEDSPRNALKRKIDCVYLN